MSVPSIDNYGPVDSGRFTTKQTESALNCMVLQPLDDYGTYNDSGNESYVEIWKGPITAMTNITNGINVMGVKFVVGFERPNIPDSNKWVRRFGPPDIPAGWFWMVNEVTVSECNPAGDHGFLTVKYIAKNSEWETKNATGGGRIDASKEKWMLEWQSRSASALIYLAKKFGTLKFIKWVNPAVKNEGRDIVLDENGPDLAVFAKMAIDAMNAQTIDSRIRLGKYQFVWKDAVYELPKTSTPANHYVNPQAVVDKYIANVKPILHYPILKKITVANFKRSEFNNFPKWNTVDGDKGDPLGRHIDTEVDFPVKCPFSFETSPYSYKWIKTADNFETDSVTKGHLIYTRTEVWWGDLYWDKEFYSGNNRWIIGGQN